MIKDTVLAFDCKAVPALDTFIGICALATL
jgi:hypothetical protein